MNKPGREIRCPNQRCKKLFGMKDARGLFVLELNNKFSLEANLLEMPPGWLVSRCACGEVVPIQ